MVVVGAVVGFDLVGFVVVLCLVVLELRRFWGLGLRFLFAFCGYVSGLPVGCWFCLGCRWFIALVLIVLVCFRFVWLLLFAVVIAYCLCLLVFVGLVFVCGVGVCLLCGC